MPEDTGFYIDDVCIPHSWYPIEDGRNAQLVVDYDGVDHFVAIDSGNYTATNLGVAIVDAINKNSNVVKCGAHNAIFRVKLQHKHI